MFPGDALVASYRNQGCHLGITRSSLADFPTNRRENRKHEKSLNLPSVISSALHLILDNHISANFPGILHQASNDLNSSRDDLLTLYHKKTPTASPKENIAALWREIHGSKDWAEFLSPVHPFLRREIVKYGEFAQATYDAFDDGRFSRFCGSCRFGRNRLLSRLGLNRSGYEVTRYLYAMSHIEMPAWM